MTDDFDPTRDLELHRSLRASPAQIWQAWSDPELLKRWWAPTPVEVTEAAIDLRPGGRFFTRMRLPDGSEMPGEGCFLEVVPQRVICWTSCLGAGYRPSGDSFMTARITLTPEDSGTDYHARVLHGRPEDRTAHVEMGFYDGWGKMISQLDHLACAQS